MRGSGGPCDHCGRTQSPCWRKGPPEKNTLCNACGARWLVKKSLEGYLPGQTYSIASKSQLGHKPRTKPPRKPRSTTARQLDQNLQPQQRRGGAGKAPNKKLSPAAQAAYAQLTLLTNLEHHALRLVAAPSQPPLFVQPSQSPTVMQRLLHRDGGLQARLEPTLAMPQLLVIPGVNIQVKDSGSPPAASLRTESTGSLRRRSRKGSPLRAST